MFGSEAIVDCDDDRVCLHRDLPADNIVRVEIADDPAAAVKVDERGQHAFGRAVQPQGNCARRSSSREIANLKEIWSRRAQRRAYVAVLAPRL